MPSFCRDCFEEQRIDARTCTVCSSPRLAAHDELYDLSIAHIDCDAFYASVEKRDNPDLADKPVIVGGGTRGVVSTCCYVARRFGVRSAMPMFKALKLCPEAVVIRPNMQKYSIIGRTIRSMMDDLTPIVKSVSIDEAFLDLTGTTVVHGGAPALSLAKFAKRVQKEVGVTVSIGLSYNRFLAKVASELDKPNGFAVIGKIGVAEFLAPKSVGIIPGIGPVFQKRLEEKGIKRIGDLQQRDPRELERLLGDEGLKLSRLAHGEDHRTVTPNGDSKSVSAETTFNTDISDHDALNQILLELSEKVALRLRRSDYAGLTINLKLKLSDFKLITRSRALNAPTQIASRIAAVGRELLAKEPKGKKYRLIGIGVSEIVPASQADLGDLIDTTAPKEAALERTLDQLRDRFGQNMIHRAAIIPKKRDPEGE
jgi:DNA polymerase-4